MTRRRRLKRAMRKRPTEDNPIFGSPRPPEGFGFKSPPAVVRRRKELARRRRRKVDRGYTQVYGDERRTLS